MADHRIVELVLAGSPYPLVRSDDVVQHGLALEVPEVCLRCSDRRCIAREGAPVEMPVESLCYRGRGYVRFTIEGETTTIVGLLSSEARKKLPRAAKKAAVDEEVVSRGALEWVRRAVSIADSMGRDLQASIRSAGGILHDVQASVSVLIRTAEQLVSAQGGVTEEENFERLSPKTRSLVKAVQVLKGRMAVAPLLSNPEAATFGQRHALPIYKMVDRLVRAFNAADSAGPNQLRLHGASSNKPTGYDSVETVAFVLLDNALKYSHQNHPVEVEVNDVGSGVRVSVTTMSPVVDEFERASIFKQGWRGRNGRAVASAGSGLGLYIAQVVAEANGFRVRFDCGGTEFVSGGVPYSRNSFSFRVG